MAKPQCPKCNSENFFYVQKSIEYHTMENLPENGHYDLCELVKSYNDDSFEPRLVCLNCHTSFDLLLKDFYQKKKEN